MNRQLLADSSLVLCTLVWGATFVLVKDSVAQVTPLLFIAARFALGALTLALLTLAMGRFTRLTMRELKWGTFLGILLFAGYAFQTAGLQYTTASNGGFITGLSVAIVPLLALPILRHRPHPFAVFGVVLATVGLALLSLRFDRGITINPGDVLVFCCAVAFAFHITFIARSSPGSDPFRLATVQVAVAALLSCLFALAFEHPVSHLDPSIWASAAFLGIVASGVLLVVQVSAQRYTTPVHTALIFTLEPVFAAFFAVWLQGDNLGGLALAGAALILLGMLLAEAGPQLIAYRARRSRRYARSQNLT